MRIVDSVAKAISDWQIGDSESAMMHACNAVNGTATKAYKGLGDRAAFTTLLRDNYAILGPMGLPGMDVEKTLFGVDLQKASHEIREFDLADVIYKIHRCSHGHGDELLKGFELIPDAAGPHGTTHFIANIVDGTVQLSDRVIFAMLGVVVFSPVNASQKSDFGYYLTYNDGVQLPINEWWGRADDFLKIVADAPCTSLVIYEFASDDPVRAIARASAKFHIKISEKPEETKD
ncbi:hypothetical protein PS684_05003 [Pseudomonas fluorescens]|nr:hypothetical protein PS681_03440 [Pseudomonas fluorescens]VVN63500.1 hypothetical protein PS684_05003 [Pseudomonas fluorescens]